MHVAIVPSRQGGREYKAYLLRQTYRDQGQVKHRTLANLSMLPLGLDRMLASRPRRERELVVGMVVMRVLKPSRKLATTRNWQASTLAQTLGVESADEDELYAALDWLLGRQQEVERQLAERHLGEGSLVLYDLTSTGMEGRHCSLAKLGYSRDGKRGQLQVEVGLLTDREGCPVAVEVLSGNAGDPSTVAAQVEKLRERFRISEVVLVGDRGMLTSARIEQLRQLGEMGWISAVRGEQIRLLVAGGELQLGLFDERNLAEIQSPRFPGERLVVCKNGELAQQRARKRVELLAATEGELTRIRERVAQGRLVGQAQIGLRVGQVVGRYKVAKRFRLEISDTRFHFERDQGRIAEEAALDGLYVIRSSVSAERMSAQELVGSYKRLAQVERDFRMLKATGLQLRPVYHRLEDRVRAHVFLCFLAAYLRWHLERAWAPLLFRDEHQVWTEDPVAPAQRSAAALTKAHTQRLPDGTEVHSFATLLEQLATLTKNRLRLKGSDATFERLAPPTPLQSQALQLLGLTPNF